MESKIPFEGHNSPKAMASSMAKRYNQFKKALPVAENNELFQLILDNRYKLLGNLVSVSDRNDIILKSSSSLTLLTFLTMLNESQEFRLWVNSGQNNLELVLREIFDTVKNEVSGYTEFSLKELEQKSKQYIQN